MRSALRGEMEAGLGGRPEAFVLRQTQDISQGRFCWLQNLFCVKQSVRNVGRAGFEAASRCGASACLGSLGMVPVLGLSDTLVAGRCWELLWSVVFCWEQITAVAVHMVLC